MAGEIFESRAQDWRAGQVLLAGSAHHEDGPRLKSTPKERQEAEAHLIAPVKILEDQDHRLMHDDRSTRRIIPSSWMARITTSNWPVERMRQAVPIPRGSETLIPQPDNASREQIVCDSATSGYELGGLGHACKDTQGRSGHDVGTRTVDDGTDGGILVDLPCDRIPGLSLLRDRHGAHDERRRPIHVGPHHADGEEMARLRREVDDLREQMKKQGAAR